MVIGAGPGRLPTYLTRRIQAQRSSDFRMKIFIHSFIVITRELKNNIEISRRQHLAISCLVAASFLPFRQSEMEACRRFLLHCPPRLLHSRGRCYLLTDQGRGIFRPLGLYGSPIPRRVPHFWPTTPQSQ